MDHRSRLTKWSALFVALAAVSGSAHAQTPRGVWFTGGTVGDSLSGYAGAIHSLPGASLGHGLAMRVSANAGNYEYDAGPARIDADYVGGEAALVYQVSGPWGWANGAVGPRYTHTRLSPADPGNARSGSRWDIGLQTDGALDGKAWRLGWFGSYGPFDEAYQARLQIGRKFAAQELLRLGVEGGVQGDPSYRKTSIGAFAAIGLGGRFELQLGSGVTKEEDRKVRAYGSIGLSRVF